MRVFAPAQALMGLYASLATARVSWRRVAELLDTAPEVQERPDAIAVLLAQYFETLRVYDAASARLHADLAAASNLPGPSVEAMLRGVQWATLNDNGAIWFGITPSGLPEQEGLVSAINGAASVLVAAGDFPRSPLPDRDPYRITNKQFVASLYLKQIDGAQAGAGAAGGLSKRVPQLDDEGWQRLKEVGTLKIESLSFARGTASLDDDGRAMLAQIAERISHYPNYRLLVKGHTGVGGDTAANLELSKRRAEAVLEQLVTAQRMDPNRIRALGYGSSQPLPRLPDESERAYAYRLPRVEFALVAERF
jgi:outer membrane protein OmpA-like peptidoglycan-associated protein